MNFTPTSPQMLGSRVPQSHGSQGVGVYFLSWTEIAERGAWLALAARGPPRRPRGSSSLLCEHRSLEDAPRPRAAPRCHTAQTGWPCPGAPCNSSSDRERLTC